MIRRNTWIILIVFIILLGITWAWQRSKEEAALKATPTPGARYLFTVQETDLNKLEMRDIQGRQIVLERDVSGGWALKVPQTEATDTERSQQAMTQVATLDILSEPDPAPEPEVAGLATPTTVITTTMSGGGQTQTALIGNLTPIANGYFARTPDGRVVVVSKYSVDEVLKLLDNPPVQPTPTTIPSTATPITSTLTFTPTIRVPTATITPIPTISGTNISDTMIISPTMSISQTVGEVSSSTTTPDANRTPHTSEAPEAGTTMEPTIQSTHTGEEQVPTATLAPTKAP